MCSSTYLRVKIQQSRALGPLLLMVSCAVSPLVGLTDATDAADSTPLTSLCNGTTAKPQSDWLGTDILPDDRPLYTANASECCAACANHTTSGTAPCLYWSRYTSKFQGRCYLKTHAVNRHANKDMESGMMPGAPDPGGGPSPPGPPAPPAPPARFIVNLDSPTRQFHKPFLECVGSSHMAMGLLVGNNMSGRQTAAGKGLQARVGALWRDHLKLVHDELNMSMFRGHGLFDDDVGIYQGVGKPINTVPLDSLFGFTTSVGIRPVVELSYCPVALAGECHERTDAYQGAICAPRLNASYAHLVPLPRHVGETMDPPDQDYAQGNAEYARMVKETVSHLVKTFGVEEVRKWKFEAWNEPNGMGSWCRDGAPGVNCNDRNTWGNHNLTSSESYYPAWYKAIAEAVLSVDSQLIVGGPASSDCWNNGISGSKCYGGHARPTVEQLLATPGQNWALGIVNWAVKNDAPIKFASTHSYSTPCGNATSLYEEFRMFTDVISQSSIKNLTAIITEWSSNPEPSGVACTDVYDPAQGVVSNYHDTAAQGSFAAKALFLIDGMVPLLSHWAFSDVFEEQGWTWDVFNGGFGLVNRWGVRKPVFNVFKLLSDSGSERLNVTSLVPLNNPGGEGIVLFASVDRVGGWVHLILVNHENPATNVTITLSGSVAQDALGSSSTSSGVRLSTNLKGTTVARIDDTHANAYTAWVGMGSPKADSQTGDLDPKIVAALHAAAAVVEEPLEVQSVTHARASSQQVSEVSVVVMVPHHGVARVKLALA